jgi:hypothetical protein
MSAAGDFVPPILIFEKLRFKQELSEGSPPGTKLALTESRWITSEVFVQWLKHFIATVKPSKYNKALIVLDGHSTHTKSLKAIELTRENGVLLLSIPVRTIHQLQPLHISFSNPYPHTSIKVVTSGCVIIQEGASHDSKLANYLVKHMEELQALEQPLMALRKPEFGHLTQKSSRRAALYHPLHIVSDDGNIEKHHERVEDRPASSTRGSTSEHQERTTSKDPVKEAGASSPRMET